ncbi:hypothetical protein ES288_D09G186800v1 [Gossypium darwinii]|uniref:Uncharacterized protein n=1 Tax=Gossypium darwinii TaxID=34276 RepID=A0A5D2BDK8_GOSDA|nr:hypothetical protein ES288_D09G186800v1 [Gossypium darwinii]
MNARRMDRKKTMTMNWDGLRDDDDEFFDPSDTGHESEGSDDENEDFDDCHVSFASTVPPVTTEFRTVAATATPVAPDYDMWMTSPGSIKARRQKLFQGMGLNSNKQLLSLKRAITNKVAFHPASTPAPAPARAPAPAPARAPAPAPAPAPTRAATPTPTTASAKPEVPLATKSSAPTKEPQKSSEESSKRELQSHLPVSFLLVRSRSEGEIESRSIEKQRKLDMLGTVSKQRLARTYSMISAPQAKAYLRPGNIKASKGNQTSKQSGPLTSIFSKRGFEAFFLIKNLDTGKEFIVNEYDQDGKWNKLSDLQTGKKLTMEEFDKCVGYSPVVKELMRRANDNKSNSYISKSLKMSMSKGAAMLKSIKGVANSMALRGEKEREVVLALEQKNNANKNGNNQWVKVRQTGKSYKELSALNLCQEIQAHEGSIWIIKFSTDARYLASAGEDTVIHVWEIQECEVLSNNEGSSVTPGSSPLHPSLAGSMDLDADKRKGKVPDYVRKPEVVFSLSDRPIYSLSGHTEDVLDLSWSKSQQLLSSSMDKTVRLWDLESQSCIKVFAHSDYVTCIHFNPSDDNHFISGSLDAKVRIWNVPERRVVDWTDLNEMVTAACYSPDGQSAFIGSHKGNCRLYSTEECKLNQLEQIFVQKSKANAKKITGFQYCPTNPSQVLVTSADSRIRILEGSEVIYRCSGFRNTSSQIAASFTQDGKYVLTASEDSQVFVWRYDEPRNTGTAKRTAVPARGYEQFPCKAVSVAIPWPGTIKGETPSMSKKNSKRTQPGESPNNEDDTQPNKAGLPPLPKKNNTEKTTSPSEEDPAQASAVDPGIPESSSSMSRSSSSSKDDSPSDSSASNLNSSSSIKAGDSSSNANTGSTKSEESGSVPSAAAAPSIWSWFDVVGGGAGNTPTETTAWGLVIVTATLDGEIKIYQNFGLPRKINLI